MHYPSNSTARTLVTVALNGLSVLYKAGAYVQWRWRSRFRVEFPSLHIVSVDNLSFGGTGKTPLILAIGRALEAHGIRFAVITRGYKSRFEKQGIWVSSAHSVLEVGDEAFLLKRHFPQAGIRIGRNRVQGFIEAAHNGYDVAILDDGFQNAHIVKNFRILMMDADQPFYYLRHFPFMSIETDCLLCHREIPSRLGSLAQGTYRFRITGFFDARGRSVSVHERTLFAFSALGNNSRFFSDLREISCLVGSKAFPDHHSFSHGDMQKLDSSRRAVSADYLVASEKDYVKLSPDWLSGLPFIFSRNEIQLNSDAIERILSHAKKKE